jgi:hypothetical protein
MSDLAWESEAGAVYSNQPILRIDNRKSTIDNSPMCRSIKKLRNAEPATTPDDVQAAALQFVRKVSGYRVPAKKNEEAFNEAVAEVTRVTSELLAKIEVAR